MRDLLIAIHLFVAVGIDPCRLAHQVKIKPSWM
jgi:hypothetical protein